MLTKQIQGNKPKEQSEFRSNDNDSIQLQLTHYRALRKKHAQQARVHRQQGQKHRERIQKLQRRKDELRAEKRAKNKDTKNKNHGGVVVNKNKKNVDSHEDELQSVQALIGHHRHEKEKHTRWAEKPALTAQLYGQRIQRLQEQQKQNAKKQRNAKRVEKNKE